MEFYSNQTVKIFLFKLSKFSFSNCQNFHFQTVKIFFFELSKFSFFKLSKFFFFKLSKFSFSNCQNFPFQTVKIFIFKLSKFSFSNCQNFLFQTLKKFGEYWANNPINQQSLIIPNPFKSHRVNSSNIKIHMKNSLQSLANIKLSKKKYKLYQRKDFIWKKYVLYDFPLFPKSYKKLWEVRGSLSKNFHQN